MNIEQQLQILIDQAPQDGTTPEVITHAVNPVLQKFAAELQHLDYFVHQSTGGNWLLTTLSNRKNPNLEKKVIYAFSAPEDGEQFAGDRPDPDLTLQRIPVTHILFQLFALQQLDSIVFMETAGNTSQGIEVHRQDLQDAIQAKLRHYQRQKNSPSQFA
jgi:hypothetical protein